MALYALGDLHLPFGRPVFKDVFGPVWHNHPQKILHACRRRVRQDDTLVLTGDHSWARTLEEALPDLEWIAALPGRKILLRGNHDYFWEAGKTAMLNRRFAGRLHFLQSNYFTYGEVALVGTKGYCWEGHDSFEHYQKLLRRETGRLAASFDAAERGGFRRFIVFLHYPPTTVGEQASDITRLCEARGAEQVIYSHSHGERNFHTSLEGEVNGIFYRLVSGDYVRFKPQKLLD